MNYVPNIIIIGYGRTQYYQIQCLKCKTQYFPGKTVEIFCEDCLFQYAQKQLTKYIKPVNQGDQEGRIGHIVGYEHRFESSKQRSRMNYNKVYKRDDYTCQYCGYNPRLYDYFDSLWIDHIIPHAYGGGNQMHNMVVACRRCNLLASSSVFNSFEEKRTYILQQREKEIA